MTAVAIDKPTINLTILVKDKGAAIREIEALLGQLNARIEEKGKREEKEILKATIASLDFAVFLDRLERIGHLQLEKGPVAAPEEKVTINITIVDNP
jgi:hypothetical protein